MPIEFAPSARGTLGLEWEIACVDPVTRELVPVAPEILARVRRDREYPQATAEFLTNTVEIVSGPHHETAAAVADLETMLGEVRGIADRLGVDLMAAGTHPFSLIEDQEVTPDKERYATYIDRMRWWGSSLIWGLHVHVAVGSGDRAIAALEGILRYYPHLQALSASSPFYLGADTGYASNRAMIYQVSSTAGLPPELATWSDYESVVDDLIAIGVLADESEVRWDVRPSPRWGTLEVRICDAPSTVEEVRALAALVQCLVEHLLTRIEDDRPLPTLQPWFVRENKWRAARYGLDCEAIVDRSGRTRPVVDDILDLLDELDPVSRRLGCSRELRAVEALIDRGPGYQRQRSTAARHDGDLRAVVDALVRELAAPPGVSAPTPR